MQADVARLRGDPGLEKAFAGEALGCLSAEDAVLGSFARYHLAVADWMTSNLAEAERGLTGVVGERLAEGEQYLAARACYDLGQVQLAQGSLRAAAVTYRRAVAIAGQVGRARPAAAGIGLAGLAEVRRERGDLEGALDEAAEGVALCRHLAYSQPLSAALVTLACTRQALGDLEGAIQAADEAVAVVPSAEIAPLHNLAQAARARLLISLGRAGDAMRWAQERGLGDEDEVPYAREREYLALARILLATQAPERAWRLADRIAARAEAEGRTGSLTAMHAFLALALEGAGEQQRALQALTTALALAWPEGQVAVFADEGPAMGRLLRRLAAARDRDHSPALRGIPAEYLGRLIRNCLSEIPADPLTAAPAATAGIVEPLTAREREVLRLLAAGRANREIASDLVVTLDTVKKHVGHICRKLGAANRTQAVAHARELGLVR